MTTGTARPRTEERCAAGIDEQAVFGGRPQAVKTGSLAMLRELPGAIGQTIGLLWTAGRGLTVTVLACQTAAAALTGLGLLAGTRVLAALLAGGPTPQRITAALPSLALVGGVLAARGALTAAVAEAQSRLTPRVLRHAHDRLYEATAAVELAAFDDPDWQEALSRARQRTLPAIELAVAELLAVAAAIAGLLAVGGILATLHPLLLVLLTASVIPHTWAAMRAARTAYTGEIPLAALYHRQQLIADLITGRPAAAEIRAYGAERFLLAEYRRWAEAVQNQRQRLELTRARTTMAGRTLGGIGVLITLIALGALLNAGVMPLAAAATAVMAIRAGQASFVQLATTANRLYERGLYIGDFNRFLADSHARAHHPTGDPMPRDFAAIHLDDVTFCYPGTEKPAVEGVDLSLVQGEVIALVGENGSGKTTLARLLAGLYRPTAGTIAWGGPSPRVLAPGDLRRLVGLLGQEPVRWPLSAHDNITLGRPAPRPSALDRALSEAGADQVLAGLPHGAETLLSRHLHGGTDLSGGQWQRLALARALYGAPSILICDEPTAPLDARAEQRAYDTIRRQAAQHGTTVVLITHRLASVRHADKIYVLDHGHLIEHGTHDELLARNGDYAQLYRLQAAAHAPPTPHRRETPDPARP
ncbi:ABC transporter ATP-binding protein [Actinomadura verrucosospora]|uniref:ABC transporter ATP-binding protein n=1 Tax=Actinomadura verrucosospora TaxID=46165 RepID=UPI00156698AA|nr:ATP-binding cassette domain-containing protein [Actinomadura verrucosospora]